MTYLKSIEAAITSDQLDAFARLRVSEPYTVFDSKQIHDSQALFWDDQETSGSGTSSSHGANTASTTIGVGTTTAGVRVRQTFIRFNYQPGKSQLIFATFVLDKSGGGTGITRRVGYFDDDNGLFLEDAEGTYGVGVRTFSSGSAVDTVVAQASWNIDPLDGTGPSGMVIDFTKAQILIIDFEWLGVGAVRFGFMIDGVIHYVHQVNNANNLSQVYMSTPNLPVRYEIENDGTGAASTLEHICSSVVSEGGRQDTGTLHYASTSGTHVDANAANTVYAIVGIRLKSGQLDSTVDLARTSIIDQTGGDFEWLLILNPTVAGTFTYGDVANSAAQTATGATANTVTGGTVLDGGFIAGASGSASAGAVAVLQSAIRLGSAIDGTPDEIVLCARPLGTNQDIEGSITWREAR